MKKTKIIGIGIASLFLISSASAFFWNDWISIGRLESNYQTQVLIVSKQLESVATLKKAKELATVNFNNAMEQLATMQKQKFLAHCSLYAEKKNSGQEPEDARIEQACELEVKSGNGIVLYKKIYSENFSTVKKN